MKMKFEHSCFGKRLKSMLSVGFRRMFTMPLFYILAGVSLVIPVLILVMTTMMDGSVSANPQIGVETIMEGLDNTRQALGSVSGSAMTVDLTGMCNINLICFMAAVLICIFVSDDFRSGCSKNLFAVRAKRTDYVISKTLVSFVGGVCMVLGFFVVAMLGGTVAGLSFDTGTAGVSGVGMLFFIMIPMLTPLDSTITNVVLCLAGGVLFSVGLGAISNTML